MGMEVFPIVISLEPRTYTCLQREHTNEEISHRDRHA